MQPLTDQLRIFFVLVFSILVSMPASADHDQHKPITDQLCTLAGHADLKPETVLSLRTTHDCSSGKFAKSTEHLWIAGSVSELAHDKPNFLVIRGSRQQDIKVFLAFADGTTQQQTFDTRSQAEHWHPVDSIALPINPDGKTITDITISVDRPWDPANWGAIELVHHGSTFDGHVYQLVLIGLFCGLLFAPIFLNIVFSLVVENRFVIFHGVMMLCIITYAVSWSGLIFPMFPDLTMMDRSTLNHLVIPVAVFAAALLTQELCEGGTLSTFWRRSLTLAGAVPILVGWPLVLFGGDLPHIGSQFYHALFLLPFLAIPATLIVARLKGSHMALVQLVGWSGLIVLVGTRILIGMAIIPDTQLTEIGFFPVLVFEAIVTTLTVSYRIVRLRQERDQALAQQAETLQVAETDYLTNIPNRRAFVEHFSSLLARKNKRRQSSALLLLDLDHFKKLNDTHGHEVGDEVLIQFAALLDKERRYEDVCARIGGEEFAVLVHAPTPHDTLLCANRLCQVIASHKFDVGDIDVGHVTVSIGVASIDHHHGGSFTDHYARADEALYQAKQFGRNQVVAAPIPKGPDDATVDDVIRAMTEDKSSELGEAANS
ncbi:MAG: diguanylate cyclase [Pseudomonadota bacterium]